MHDVQRIASETVAAVAAGQNLNTALAVRLARHPALNAQQRGAIQDLSYGALRYGHRLRCVLEALLEKPLREPALLWLMTVALYQLEHTRAAPHAVVDHAVCCAHELGHARAGGLVNAVLRNFLRRRKSLMEAARRNDVGRYSFPHWWIARLRREYPLCFPALLEAGNTRPPLTLRVNRRRTSVEAYLASLDGAGIDARAVGGEAVRITRPLPVERLPGFAQGLASVQDRGAQLAADLLDVSAGMRVLDACAAPGGKTSHLLERADLALTAIDSDATRLVRVRQNLDRLGLQARLLAADAAAPQTWWDGEPFARVLADVPCTASGVVRRHPDIKWLRREADIARFAAQQRTLLDALWRVLASGGKLLYATCSVFERENGRQVEAFLARHADARRLPLDAIAAQNGVPQGQLLPDEEHDGFYYALVQKI